MSKVHYDLEDGVPGVRLATKNDEGEIYALLLMLHAENGIFSLNPKKVIDGIRYATERHGGLIYVIEEDRRLVATLGMLMTCDWYSDDEYLLERWNFVHPDYRTRDYARKLLEQGKWTSEWFRSRGKLMPLQVGINTFDRLDAKVRLYARHMACIGAYFIYGQLPRRIQDKKLQEELRQIEESNKFSRRQARKDGLIEVRPVVENIIRVSQRGANHGQQ
jgi:GNAT superfamily N-acetyltransferase